MRHGENLVGDGLPYHLDSDLEIETGQIARNASGYPSWPSLIKAVECVVIKRPFLVLRCRAQKNRARDMRVPPLSHPDAKVHERGGRRWNVQWNLSLSRRGQHRSLFNYATMARRVALRVALAMSEQ